MVIGLKSYKGGLLLVLGYQCNLVITLESIQEAYPHVSTCCIYQLIDLRDKKGILRACPIEINEVYANPLLAILLLDHHSV